jgi:hypothetical protein
MPSMLAPRAISVFLLVALIWALSFLVKASVLTLLLQSV